VKERADLSPLFAHLGCHFQGSKAWVRSESKAVGSSTICKPQSWRKREEEKRREEDRRREEEEKWSLEALG
jgi:hypothetical protein